MNDVERLYGELCVVDARWNRAITDYEMDRRNAEVTAAREAYKAAVMDENRRLYPHLFAFEHK